MQTQPRDTLGRPLRNLRLSVTDRCNLRCSYCMPEKDYTWLPKPRLLRFEELAHLARAFAALGVRKLRLTGGEPLLRQELDALVALLVALPGVREVALTTNGILLGAQAQRLRAAGLARLTVSLDTLRPERFRALTRRDALAETLAGIEAARAAGFAGTKLNTVVMRGVNDDELVEILDYACAQDLEPRFIEYMDVGGATRWSAADVVPRAEILARLSAARGPLTPESGDPSAPAESFRLPGGERVGVISSTTAPFCRACDRARLTADGHLFTCLYGRAGLDLAAPLRSGATLAELQQHIAAAWGLRADRGAEERLELDRREALASSDELRGDPHLEMHTRGG
jgi:cyclic pyranopterin phosphate synthase